MGRKPNFIRNQLLLLGVQEDVQELYVQELCVEV